MLRINLLPPYIADGQKKKKVIAGWTVGVIAVIAILIFKFISANSALAAAKAQEDEAKNFQSQFQAIDASIKKEQEKVAKTKEKQDFIANSQKYNDAWPTMLESVRDVTSDQILLKSLTIDAAMHKTINVTGFSQNEMNIVRWWMYLRGHKDKFETVFFNLPPHGYGGAGGGVGAGLAGRFGGGGGGFGGGMMDGPGKGMGGRMGAMAGGMPGGMPGMPGGMMGRGMGGGAPMGGMGGRAFGGAGAAGDIGQGIIEGKQGINFTAMLVLKDPMNGGVSAPSWPPMAGGGAASGMGMGGMMGGMPGGMMGGMPGGMMGGPPMGGPPMGAMGGAPGAAMRPGAASSAAPGAAPASGGLNIKARTGKDMGDE